jgi:hypothetical protein
MGFHLSVKFGRHALAAAHPQTSRDFLHRQRCLPPQARGQGQLARITLGSTTQSWTTGQVAKAERPLNHERA